VVEPFFTACLKKNGRAILWLKRHSVQHGERLARLLAGDIVQSPNRVALPTLTRLPAGGLQKGYNSTDNSTDNSADNKATTV
jgi:hypothetical protein